MRLFTGNKTDTTAAGAMRQGLAQLRQLHPQMLAILLYERDQLQAQLAEMGGSLEQGQDPSQPSNLAVSFADWFEE